MRASYCGLSGARALLFCILGPGVWSANIPMTVVGSTQTQIVVSYAATGACTITATDNNGGTNPPRDLDTSIFPHADSDLDRTAANGFRWPTIVNGSTRTVFLGGHDEIKKGADGRWYSTALQVASDHTIAISCNGGADSGTIHARTANLLPASNYPELPIPTPGAPLGGIPQPTVFWGGCSGDPKCTKVQYIDPITGVVLQRISSPIDRLGSDSFPQAFTPQIPVMDGSGAWTNADNFASRQNAGTLATTSTPNAPIFAAFDPNFAFQYRPLTTDVQAALYGNASSNGIRAGICLSQDSGQTCASGEQTVALSTAVAVQATVPPGFPSNYFTAWGAWNNEFAYGAYDIGNHRISSVSVSGSTVTMDAAAPPGFNVDRRPGSAFTLTNCSTGGPLTLHVATVDSYAQITTSESGNAASNCTYQDYASGIRVRMIDPGTVHVSVSGNWMTGGSDRSGSNGNSYYCAKTKVTDVTTDCDGITRNPAMSGYLCNFSNGIYLLQDNGRTCLQSNFFGNSGALHLSNYGSFSVWADNKSFVLADYQNPPHVWKVTANKGGNYTEYVAARTSAPDGFIYTDVTAAMNPPLATQIANFGGIVAQSLATGLWPPMGYRQTIDGNIEYSTCSGGGDPLCMFAWTDANGALLSAAAQWNTYPFRWMSQHSSPMGFSGYSIHASGGYYAQAHYNKNIMLGGPFLAPVTGVYKNGSIYQKTLTVSAATQANPAVFTIADGDIDNLSGGAAQEGAFVTCSGIASGDWTGANRSFYLHKIDNSHYAAYLDATAPTGFNSVAFPAYPGGLRCTAAPALYNIPISAVPGDASTACGGAACARVTVNLSHTGFTNYFPSGINPMSDGDPIVFSKLDGSRNEIMDETRQYYAKVSGLPAGTFDVYGDAALTARVANSLIASAAGGVVNYAETCPDPATVTLPGPLYGDSGWGSSGALKVRCVTITVNSEPCSDYAAAGEQAKYPCPSDPMNPARSSLMNTEVGDALFDASHTPGLGNHEIFLILKKIKSSETSITYTLLRWAQNDRYGRGGAYGNCRTCDIYAHNHSYGWTAEPYPYAFAGFIDFGRGATSWTPFSPLLNQTLHGDVSQGSLRDNFMMAKAYYNQGPFADDVVDVPASLLPSYSPTPVHNSSPYWADDRNDTMYGTYLQEYPNFRQVFGQFPAGSVLTKADWMSRQSGNGGYGQNNTDGTDWTRTLSKVTGTCCVYKISNPAPSGVMNLKVVNYLVHASPHWYFADKSGPNSSITDGDLGKKCHAFAANECVTGSAAGDTYIAMRGVWDPGRCVTNSATLSPPCLYPINTGDGWAVQIRMRPVDTNMTGVRRLTMFFNLPGTHYTYHNWTSSPDNKWGFLVSNPIQYRPQWQAYQGSHHYAMKLPPWPAAEDSVNRSTFVSIAKAFAGKTGDKIRIAFGYGENGDPAQLYCTSRGDTCWTSAAATASNPYLFASEPQNKTICDSGCTIQIPAIPGRVLYYQVERSNGAETVKGPLEVVTVP